MKIKQVVFPVVLLGLLFLIIAGCDNNASAKKKESTTYAQDLHLHTGAYWKEGVAIALADMDGDGDPDLVSVTSGGVKYFENVGGGEFTDHEVIAEIGFYRRDDVAVAIGDVDSNGTPDIIIAVDNAIRIIKNPILQKK